MTEWILWHTVKRKSRKEPEVSAVTLTATSFTEALEMLTLTQQQALDLTLHGRTTWKGRRGEVYTLELTHREAN